ncbi:uncharacterized protein LOC125666362 isoform X2 [Ostrea edulis]|nr:uncharacterized protein LOC125666362 isoform X2 [Ostrea edulis]XP_056007876.1 uncharacterized protein LOC125666362 isoform X2 [Ostrea edulis]
MKYLTSVWFIVCTIGPAPVYSLQVKDPKCRYRVHLPEASWHTAYDACTGSDWTLAKISSLTEMYLIDLVLQEVNGLFDDPVVSDSTGVWVDAFLRSSNNESMSQDCKSLDPQLPVTVTRTGPGDMLCIYYNRTAQTFLTDDCNTKKTFICESRSEALQDCMTVSTITNLKNGSPFDICLDVDIPSGTTDCKSRCIETPVCYTFTGDCYLFRYKNTCITGLGRSPPATLTHKSFFIHNAADYPVSNAKPLSEWCPELTPEVMQEKIDNIQRNLTVNRKETNQYIRTLTSAPDERRSARNIGIVGVSVICGVFGVIILSDCTGVIKAIQSKCGAAKDR